MFSCLETSSVVLRTGCFAFLISFLKQIAYRLTYPSQNLGAHVTYTDVLLGARSQVSQKFLNHYIMLMLKQNMKKYCLDLPGCFTVRCALGDPAWQGRWTKWSSEVPANFDYSVFQCENTHRQGKLENPARHPSDTKKTVLPRRHALLPGTSLSACAGA